MPWQETHVMDEKMKFIADVLTGDYTMTALCEYYGISRKTGYKWYARYCREGSSGLVERSRAPHHHPHAIPEKIQNRILEIKGRYPHWGPEKILQKLRSRYPHQHCWPAVSSVGALLKRHGLVCTRKRRRRASPSPSPLHSSSGSNQVWCADFKGHFQTGNGDRCNPLTISDNYSRYLICCRHVGRMSYAQVKPQFERAFREYGLPGVIRTDNGTPFSCCGLCGLSRLSVWWIRLGIFPERIAPGHPEQNGRHERMHLTLKQATAQPPARTLRAQQHRFDDFLQEYNQERPHAALDGAVPSSFYHGSDRVFPDRLPRVEYPGFYRVRCVQPHGDICVGGDRVFLGESFRGEYIGLEPRDEGLSRLWYCCYELGTLDHRTMQITPSQQRGLSAPKEGGEAP